MDMLLKKMYRQTDVSVSVPESVTADVYKAPIFKQLMPHINEWLMSKNLEPMTFPGGQMAGKIKGDTVQSYRERYEETKSKVIYPLLQIPKGEIQVAPADKK